MSETYIHLHELLEPSRGSPGHDEAREDSENKMWSEYMEEADKYDTLTTDFWKYNADGVLVFAGLLSATVATFIIEGYKKLSPDSGAQTVYLLGQISQQLVAFPPNGTSSPPTPYPEYYPDFSIVLVNSLWLLSLVSSIASAVVAALVQSWTRRYTLLPQIPSVLRDRARVRSYSFFGVLKYRMSRTTEAGAMLLHLSVFLFFAGLVIFFFTIFKPVAIVVSTCVGFFGFLYLILTILPVLDHRCPYHTPMTNICWYYWHTSLGFVGICTRKLLSWLHGILVPYNSGEVTSLQGILITWWKFFDDSVKRHGRRLKDGSLGTVVQRAIESVGVDTKALTWLLNQPAFAGTGKIQEFVDNAPADTIVRLISAPIHSEKIFFRHLLTLLRSCAPGSTGLDEDTRRCRLVVCLNAIHHIARACSGVYYGVSPPETLLEDVRSKFANISLMRSLWSDEDPTIRVRSRSICALIAKHILHKDRLRESELTWLQNVLGESSNAIYNSLENPSVVDNMNIDSFVYAVLSHDLPAVQTTSFVDTLAILMGVGEKTDTRIGSFRMGFSRLLQRAETDDHLREVADKLRRIYEAMFPSAAPEPLTSLSIGLQPLSWTDFPIPWRSTPTYHI